MPDNKLIKALEEAGYHDEARSIAAITPEQKAEFEEWLSDPVNKQRWDEAIANARRRL